MQSLSEKFIVKLKLDDRPQYRAQIAKVNANTLSKLVNGAERVRPLDNRIIAVGSVLGLSPAECFETSTAEAVGK